MFKNYIKITYRGFLKDKTSYLISIAGLAVGMFCCMLILIHVKDELSYNHFTAIVIAFPIAWWAGEHWLRSFAYRVNIGSGVFLSAGMVVVLITLFTISFQSIKAALANPIKSLRSE
jgi:hypothetical protein